jgi:hypothetical protein
MEAMSMLNMSQDHLDEVWDEPELETLRQEVIGCVSEDKQEIFAELLAQYGIMIQDKTLALV